MKLLATAALAAVAAAQTPTCTTTTNYDYFMLVTQWAITECEDVFNCQASNEWFTLHGLWPNDFDGNFPCYCSSTAFDPTLIEDLLPNLNKFWPSLNGDSTTFWEHEFTKHGTCATDVFPGEHDYFAGVLNLRIKYDIVSALGKVGISPSNTVGFTIQQFHDATAASYGFPAVVQCDTQGRIEQVNMCIGKNLTQIQCPDNVLDQCTASTVYLPASQQMGGVGKMAATQMLRKHGKKNKFAPAELQVKHL